MHNDLVEIIKRSTEIMETLEACRELALPNYYLAGGAITQAVWNHGLGLPLLQGVKDLDIVYFADEAEQFEQQRQDSISQKLSHSLPVDLKNQARVHEWYPHKFGNSISPYTCCEDGITSWLPAFAVGVRLENSTVRVCAPHGLADTFNMHVRPNKTVMNETNYLKMTASFKQRWPQITVAPW